MTPTQLESIRAARLQLLDHGDEAAAKALDWVLTAEPMPILKAMQPSAIDLEVAHQLAYAIQQNYLHELGAESLEQIKAVVELALAEKES